jgi:seryl-tRNA synthetase
MKNLMTIICTGVCVIEVKVLLHNKKTRKQIKALSERAGMLMQSDQSDYYKHVADEVIGISNEIIKLRKSLIFSDQRREIAEEQDFQDWLKRFSKKGRELSAEMHSLCTKMLDETKSKLASDNIEALRVCIKTMGKVNPRLASESIEAFQEMRDEISGLLYLTFSSRDPDVVAASSELIAVRASLHEVIEELEKLV